MINTPVLIAGQHGQVLAEGYLLLQLQDHLRAAGAASCSGVRCKSQALTPCKRVGGAAAQDGLYAAREWRSCAPAPDCSQVRVARVHLVLNLCRVLKSYRPWESGMFGESPRVQLLGSHVDMKICSCMRLHHKPQQDTSSTKVHYAVSAIFKTGQ